MNICRINSIDSKEELIAKNVNMADSFLLRLKGLLGRKSLEEGGIVLFPCSSIHCYGMKFQIDVFFLDKDKKVIYICENMRPNTYKAVKGAVYVVELKSGTASKWRIKAGEALVFRGEC